MKLKELLTALFTDEDTEENQLLPVRAFLSEHYHAPETLGDTCGQPCLSVAETEADTAQMSLETFLKTAGVSFSQRLMQFTEEKKITVPKLCRRSGIDRRHFSKMKNNVDYRPSKSTVIALSAGLRLSFEEAVELLSCAGYTLSKSSRADLIAEYCLRNGIYDIDKINELLFAYNEALLSE